MFADVPKCALEAECPPAGSCCCRKVHTKHCFLLCPGWAEASRNSLCCVWNCLQRTLSFEIALLSTWGLDFPKVTHTVLFRGSQSVICSDKAPSVLGGCATHTHQSTADAQFHSALCLPKQGDWKALIWVLFCSDRHQKFWTSDRVVTLIMYSICCKPTSLRPCSSFPFVDSFPQAALT